MDSRSYQEYRCCSFGLSCQYCANFYIISIFKGFFTYSRFRGARVEAVLGFSYYLNGYYPLNYSAISAASSFTSFLGCFFAISSRRLFSESICRAPMTSITNITDLSCGRERRLLRVPASTLHSSRTSRNFQRTGFRCCVSNGNFSSPSTTSLLNNFPVFGSSFKMVSVPSSPFSNTLGCFSSTKLLSIAVNLITVYGSPLIDSSSLIELAFLAASSTSSYALFLTIQKMLLRREASGLSSSSAIYSSLILNYYKSNQMSATMAGEALVIDAIALFNEELKEKNLKKQAVQEVGTIALVLPVKRIRQELVPLLVKTFVQQTLDMRIAIIRSFSSLMEYLRQANQSFVLLQFILDVLCAFSEEELRKEAYTVLQKILESLDLRAYQEQLIKVIRELSKETDRNIKEVVLRLVRHLYIVAQNQNQQYLLEVIAQYRSQEEQILLAKELAEFIKIMPPFPENKIHSILKDLLASSSGKVRSKLVEPVILLAKALDQEATQEYFSALLGDTCPEVLAALVLQVQGIAELPSKKVLGQVLQMIDTPERHDSTVRAAILEVLQFIPLTQSRRTYILSSSHFKSLSLSKALADSLCKIHDIQALGLLIESSDTEFKNKLFPKLPSACEIHVKLMEYIFAQKNWRSKLTLLQNIEKRMESEENVQIFIPKLMQQLGDKIGVLRSSVVRLLALIVRARRIQLKDLTRPLNTSMNSKNWFQRQSVLVLMQHLAPHYPQFSASDRTIFKTYISQGLSSSIHNLKSLSESIRSQCNLQID